MGGTAPTASKVCTKENAWPAKKSLLPEQTKPKSWLPMPTCSFTAPITGTMNSTSVSETRAFCCTIAEATTATSRIDAIPRMLGELPDGMRNPDRLLLQKAHQARL